MPAKKRAPGGGRKPKGDNAKRASMTMRMSQDLRNALDAQAHRNGRTISREIELLLVSALKFPEQIKKEWRADHHYGLGRMVARLAWTVETATGIAAPLQPGDQTWMDDPFTAAAVRAAIDITIRSLIPAGAPKVPAKVQASAEWNSQVLPPERAAFYQTPEGVGEIAAMSLLDQLRDYEWAPLKKPDTDHYADIFYEIPMISEKLGMAPRAKAGSIKRRI